MSNDKYVSDVGVASIASGCRDLEFLRCTSLYLLADPRIGPKKKKDINAMPLKKQEEPWQSVIGIAAVAKYCLKLQTLDVTGCFRLNTVLLRQVPKGLLHLKVLNLTGCNQAETESLIAVGKACRLIEELTLNDCGDAVTTPVLDAFCTTCLNLRVVEVARCANVRGGAIRAISHCEKLEKLDLSGCKSLSDVMMLPICEVDKVLNLHYLYMIDIPKLTDTGLAWISMGCTSLRVFSFKGTEFSKVAIKSVKDNFPLCDMISNNNFSGFWPKTRLKDRIIINDYYNLHKAIIVLQSRLRKHMDIIRVQNLKNAMLIIKSAIYVQKFVRMIHAKAKFKLLQVEHEKRKSYCFKVQGALSIHLAKVKARRIRKNRVFIFHGKKAKIIQQAYRNYRSKGAVKLMQITFFKMVRRRRKAILTLQAAFRMFKMKMDFAKLKELIMAKTRVRRRKALVIQRIFRGYVGRRYVWFLREHLNSILRIKIAAAKTIQYRWRSHRTDYVVRMAIKYRAKRVIGALRIQSVLRGKLARLKYTEEIVRRQEIMEANASLKIQTCWRAKAAKLRIFAIIEERRKILAMRIDAVTTFAKYWRSRDARMQLKELRFQREEAIRMRVRVEYWAALKIQALYRGNKGRAYFDEKLREKKGKWKELIDEESGHRFFYNKLSGEIRWRMPQDLMDLIPRPKCDNCQEFLAGIECGVCNEFFCHNCWNSVHYGGRRKDHEFRALYDYYNRRIDYGDGNYPSKWPSEVMQDDVQGWMLRVAPIRAPIATYGTWEHYYTEEERDKKGNVVHEAYNFFFNRKTFEATYDAPPELINAKEANSFLQESHRSSPFQTTTDITMQLGYGETFNSTSFYQTMEESPYPADGSNYNYSAANNESFYPSMSFDTPIKNSSKYSK